MKDNKLEVANIISNPMFFLDSAFKVLFMNKNAIGFTNYLKSKNIEIEDVIEQCKVIGENEDYIDKKINVGDYDIKISIYLKRVSNMDNISYLICVKEQLICSKQLNKIINSIGDMVSIHNEKGQLLNYNDEMAEMIYKNIGIDVSNHLGININKLVEWGLAEDTITDKVIKNKKREVKNVTYSNGKTIMYTGIPIFNKDNTIENVVLTGRDISQLVELERNLIETQQKNEAYIKRIEEMKKDNKSIIYSSKKMENIIKISKRVAKTDSSVFIRGSSGVGKEEIANYIHKNSNRKDKGFIAVNCAAIPSELLEMEFFGYEEGSFTGAKKGGKIGLLECASGGTLFLDEIGELPLSMQSKLLRAIQENGFMRVGGNEFIETDIRYISATNISEKDLFSGNKFRQDLYYRISVVPINIPDIKDRKEDIIPLTSYFLNKFNDKYGRKVRVRKNTVKIFMKYNWPGNVREIKNIMERLIILVEGDYIEEDDFKDAVNFDFKIKEEKSISINGSMTLNEAHELLDKVMIERSIEEKGSILGAARLLDIAPSTLHRKRKKKV